MLKLSDFVDFVDVGRHGLLAAFEAVRFEDHLVLGTLEQLFCHLVNQRVVVLLVLPVPDFLHQIIS